MGKKSYHKLCLQYALPPLVPRASPLAINVGRDPYVPLALFAQMLPAWEEDVPVLGYMEKYKNRPEAVTRFTRENMGTYNKTNITDKKLHQFPEGSLVWLYTPPV